MALSVERETFLPCDLFGILIGSILNVIHQSFDTITGFCASLMVNHILFLRKSTRMFSLDDTIIY